MLSLNLLVIVVGVGVVVEWQGVGWARLFLLLEFPFLREFVFALFGAGFRIIILHFILIADGASASFGLGLFGGRSWLFRSARFVNLTFEVGTDCQLIFKVSS